MNSEGARKWMLAAGSVAASLLLAEAAARIFLSPPLRVDRTAIVAAQSGNRETWRSFHRADPTLGWTLTRESIRYRKRLFDSVGALEYDVTYSVESGRRRTAATDSITARPVVIAAGCSFTFGLGLNDEDTWPWLLQEQVPNYQILNAGVMAYGTDQALMAAEREIRAHPAQAVVLGFGDFQIERNRAAQGWMYLVYPFSKPLFAVRAGQAEYQRQVRLWPGGTLANYSFFFGRFVNALANQAYAIPSHWQATELTASLIETYAKRFQALGTRLAVAVLPHATDNGPQEREDREFISHRLRAAQIPVITIAQPRGANGAIDIAQLTVGKSDRHPNRRYNQALVAQVVPFLRSEGIIGVNGGERSGHFPGTGEGHAANTQ